MQNKRFWNFNQVSEDRAELLIYDEIAAHKSTDWLTGAEGSEVVPKEFREELDSVAAENIVVRINSQGGEVFAAEAIATLIKEKRAEGKRITCKIDGICASAAVQIAMACETIAIPSSAYMMIHDPLTFCYGYYQQKHLTKLADTLNKIKAGIINAYSDKTGIGHKEIEKMMTAETWFTGDEAVERGFADEVLFDGEDPEEPKNRINELYSNSVMRNYFAAYVNVPDKLKEAFNVKNILENKKKKGETEMDIKNAQNLAEAYPEFVEEIVAFAKQTGAEEERARIKAIDELSGKVDGRLIEEAKYENFATAETVAYNAMREGKFVNKAVIDGFVDDAARVNAVSGAINPAMAANNAKNAELENEYAVIDRIAGKIFKK